MKYSEYAPTSFDTKGLALPQRQDWIVVPVLRHRDSSPMEASNFATALKELRGESLMVEIHRFGHWAHGWYEIILVHPELEKEVDDIERRLSVYPILDEDDCGAREMDAAYQAWEDMSTRERMDMCIKKGISIFAARSDSLPDEIDYSNMY